MLKLLLELIPTLALGLALGLRYPLLPGRIAPLLVRYGIPLGVAALLLRSGLNRDFLLAAAFALVLIASVMLLLHLLPPLRRLLPNGALQLGAATGNTTYFGIPVALALLPPPALGAAIAYDLAATLLSWTLGPRLLKSSSERRRSFRRDLSQSPATHGFLLAFVLQLTPWQEPLASLLWWPARLVLLLALLLVGMRIGVMQQQGELAEGLNWQSWRKLAPALSIKLLLLPLLFALVTTWLGLPGLVADALVLQAAAPTAISVLLMAEAAGEGVNDAAGLVLISTAMALVTVPLWWWLIN